MIDAYPNDDVDEQDKDRICHLVSEILECCEDIAEDPNDALNALSGAAAFVLSNCMLTRVGAEQATTSMTQLIMATIDRAEEDGNTLWTTKPRH